MLVSGNNDVTITNDGATILNKMDVAHPAAKMLVELAKSQDIVAGDGTTSVTVLCGSLLNKCIGLLNRGRAPHRDLGRHGTRVRQGLRDPPGDGHPPRYRGPRGAHQGCDHLPGIQGCRAVLQRVGALAVDSVLKIRDPERPDMVDLKDIKILRKSGGTIDDTEMVDGLVLDLKSSKAAGGPTKVENAKIALIQFCISPPKTDMENSVVVSDYQQMDRILKEERNYIISIIKKIKASGCNVLLIQKSILRDAVTDLSLHYLAKAKILVVRDVEREDVEFICKTVGCQPVANVEQLTPEKLGHADLVKEVACGGEKVVKVTGIQNMGKTVSVLCRGSNKLVIEEADRSLHDALCVIRCLVQKRFLICGGGAPEVEVSQQLGKWSRTLSGMEAVCVKAFAEALEVIPYTLAETRV